MTNKTEDRFYFGKHGQPERFGNAERLEALLDAVDQNLRFGNAKTARQMLKKAEKELATDTPARLRDYMRELAEWIKSEGFSRPSQPERFEEIKRISSGTFVRTWVIKNYRFTSRTRSVFSDGKVVYQGSVPNPLNPPLVVFAELIKYPNGKKTLIVQPFDFKSKSTTIEFSRPGQPERFDASSLDRKGFAAASASPMLGKLLSEKQMPEGGWRAVETGGGALVISFEDGDVAGNFARRVASNGYSATAPVQSIGRYWNVEVKNGK